MAGMLEILAKKLYVGSKLGWKENKYQLSLDLV
jgi:hypothetical protein